MKPTLEDLNATVVRMEDRLGELPGLDALNERFAADLPEARDRLLAQSAALMVHQQQQRCADLARRFLQAYADKDLETISVMLTPEVRLRDWNLAVAGKEAFLAETRKNFEDADTISIEVLHLHATARSVAAELRIVVDGHIELNVVDVFDFDAHGQVRAVRSYKGL